MDAVSSAESMAPSRASKLSVVDARALSTALPADKAPALSVSVPSEAEFSALLAFCAAVFVEPIRSDVLETMDCEEEIRSP